MRKRARAAVPSETPVVDRLLDEIQTLQEALGRVDAERVVQQTAINRLWDVLRDAARERTLEAFALNVADILLEYGIVDEDGRESLRASGWYQFPASEMN